jgi:hypothetical protein
MTLLEIIKENIANCVANGFDMPQSDQDFADEMIEHGAVEEDTDMEALLATIKEARA